MDEQLKCKRCGYAITPDTKKCPICGTQIISAKRIRTLGVIQVILGLFIVVLMGSITAFVIPAMLQSGSSSTSGPHFTGTPAQSGIILLLFGVVIVFGLTSIANGAYQIVTGRRNKWIMIITFVLVFLLIVITVAVQQVLGSERTLAQVCNAHISTLVR